MKTKGKSSQNGDKPKHTSKSCSNKIIKEERERFLFEAGALYNIMRDWTVPDDWKELIRKRATA